jgi:mannose-6-phosphate isomerase-like protein (cupin superfamily)
MAKAGDVIENPMTGERIVFVETAADTDGRRLKIDLHLEPNAHNATSHIHAKQVERIAIVRGELRIVVADGEPRTLRAGEDVVLEAGVPHVWWNESGTPAQVDIEYEPALNTDEFFESFFALGRDGQTTATGAPRFWQLIVMARYFEIYDGKAPVWAQRIVCSILEPLAHALGYRAHYVESRMRETPLLTDAPASR